MKPGEVRNIEPESPERLRECLTALAAHSRLSVLRVEVAFGDATERDGPALTMIVTHSLGPQHEQAIGPTLCRALGEALRAVTDNAVRTKSEDVQGDPSGEP